jgi:hypothetical protein
VRPAAGPINYLRRYARLVNARCVYVAINAVFCDASCASTIELDQWGSPTGRLRRYRARHERAMTRLSAQGLSTVNGDNAFSAATPRPAPRPPNPTSAAVRAHAHHASKQGSTTRRQRALRTGTSRSADATSVASRGIKRHLMACGGERTRTADFYVAKEESRHDVPPGAAMCQANTARATRCHFMP